MTDYNTCLQTAATISSAIAAITAVYVAKNTFTFQRNSLLKKANIEQILKLLQQLHYLKSLTGQAVLGAADQEFTGLKQRISETRDSVKTLESMISATANADLKTVCDFVHSLNETNVFASDDNTPNVTLSRQLDNAISALQNIYHTEIK
jgi:putative flippase GtrA